MSLFEAYKPVGVLSDGDLSAGATLSGDSINCANAKKVTFLVNMQTLGGAANYILIYSGATDGALTSALTFDYAFADAAQGSASGDVFSTWSTSANLAVAHATYDNYLLAIEVDCSAMDTANGENWLTFTCADTDTGATGNITVVALVETRYSGGRTGGTVLA
jgi:TPP-dependent trihydroxycyclohexane-1,2-dione (THcHDO) dehydratase